MTNYATLRTAMVDCQIRPSDVTKFPIIDAMLKVRREVFVPTARREVAYVGEHLPLGDGRVLLDARVLAKMLDALNVTKRDLVLIVGCDYGYNTAVTARMAEAVIAVEQDAAMASEAEANLATEAVDNAVVIEGPLVDGAQRHGPYDVMLFGGAVEQVPANLLAQLKDGGRVAAVFSQDGAGQCRIGTKAAGKVTWRNQFDAQAPVLPGFQRKAAFAL